MNTLNPCSTYCILRIQAKSCKPPLSSPLQIQISRPNLVSKLESLRQWSLCVCLLIHHVYLFQHRLTKKCGRPLHWVLFCKLYQLIQTISQIQPSNCSISVLNELNSLSLNIRCINIVELNSFSHGSPVWSYESFNSFPTYLCCSVVVDTCLPCC